MVYRSVDNCTFKNNSKVAVLFTSYAPGEGDPSQLLIQQAAAEKMSVYLGLPLPPYCKGLHESSSMYQGLAESCCFTGFLENIFEYRFPSLL